METPKINYLDSLKISFSWGLKNFPSILGAVILWVLTCWIPYINVGTTIALATIPIEISKGKVISPLFIFDKKYFKYMGEFFLLLGIQTPAQFIGYMLFFAPGIVISLAWSLSTLLLLDKEMSPMDAIVNSNKYTYGNKGAMFLAQLIIYVIIFVALYIFNLIPYVGSILGIILLLLVAPILMSLKAYFYKTLVLESNE